MSVPGAVNVTLPSTPFQPSFRAIAWIEDALAPLRTSMSDDEVHQLAIAIRSVEGLEAFAWRSSGTPKTGFA